MFLIIIVELEEDELSDEEELDDEWREFISLTLKSKSH